MINIHILIQITPRDTALIYLKNLRIRHSILITKSFRQQEMSMGQGKFVKYINNQLIYLKFLCIKNIFSTYTLLSRDPETGEWNGVVGDLIKGDIDISVAALTMTTEREEGTAAIISTKSYAKTLY